MVNIPSGRLDRVCDHRKRRGRRGDPHQPRVVWPSTFRWPG